MKLSTIAISLLMSSVVLAQPTRDRTVMVGREDQEMKGAIEKAQSTLDAFLKLQAGPPKGASEFKLKVKITDSHGTEHMWVEPFAQTATGFTGTLDDSPEVVTSVSNGQTITFTRQDVSDWGYVQDGKQKGSFTVCVAFKHMPKADADAYRRDYGFEC